MIFPILASQVARITSVSHLCLAWNITCNVFIYVSLHSHEHDHLYYAFFYSHLYALSNNTFIENVKDLKRTTLGWWSGSNGRADQMVELLASKCEALSSNFSNTKKKK
jgi:hypothetical protein